MAEAKAPKKSPGAAEQDHDKAPRSEGGKRRAQGATPSRKTPPKAASKQIPKDWESVT